MRAAAMPGEDPVTLRTPEELAPKLVALLRAGMDARPASSTISPTTGC